MLNDEYEYYRHKSKSELLETLAALTAEQRQSGELTDAQMEETYRMLSPLLSDSQKRQLRALLDALR